MNNEICGQLTKSGKPCRFARGECKWHRRAEREPGPAVEAAVVTPAFEGHDARGLAWWTVDSLLRGELPASNASVIASLLRVIAGLGPDPVSEEEALAETAFRGRIMHGLPPRDAAEWARAERNYTPEAVAEFRRWAALLEADRLDDGDELILRQAGAVEGDDSLVVDHEDA